MTSRARLLRAVLLAVAPVMGCSDATGVPTGETSAEGAGGQGGGSAGQGGAGASDVSGGSGQVAAGTTASGAGGGEAGAGAGGTGLSGGGGGGWPCVDEKPVLVGGEPTGFSSCADGSLRRRQVLECPSLVPRPTACAHPQPNFGCKVDADCTDHPSGHCEVAHPSDDPDHDDGAGCGCFYGCIRDADCGDTYLCQCGDPVGHCVRAYCHSDDECDGGDCVSAGVDGACLNYEYLFACQQPSDTCGGSNDCDADSYQACFQAYDGGRDCYQKQPCPIGRPLLVEQALRQAALVAADAGWG